MSKIAKERYIKAIIKIYFSNVICVVSSNKKDMMDFKAFKQVIKEVKQDDDVMFIKLYRLLTGDIVKVRGYQGKAEALKQILELHETRGNNLDVLKFRRHSKIGCQTIQKLIKGEL